MFVSGFNIEVSFQSTVEEHFFFNFFFYLQNTHNYLQCT